MSHVLFDNNGTCSIPPSNIYNADESSFSVCYKPGKVLAAKGKRSVGAITSLEKGKTMTVLCYVNAVGSFIPPMIVYSRVRMKPAFSYRAPAGCLGVAAKSGWINTELLTRWFEYFLTYAKPSVNGPKTLLVLGGHCSHVKNLEVIKRAHESNVVIISSPSHCTHKLQPLDISFFKSVNVNYNKAIQCWHREHPGRPVTEEDFAELFSGAYGIAATVKNATSGFRASGIFPFNPNVFSDKDFLAPDATDRPIYSRTDEDTGMTTIPRLQRHQ